ncbi:MAG: hypothetical protein HIU83_02885 [Proteobacteria bacterium]|nr:hypothetical protein [Pseudomonadota bacterium]
MLVNFRTPFQMSTTDINRAAIVFAAGHYVEVLKQAASKRAVFYFDDIKEIRNLLAQYENREALPLPAKAILNARTELYYQAAKAVREAL